LDGVLKELVLHLNSPNNTVVSVDVPSGISIDVPFLLENVIQADKKYSFQYVKHSFFFK